MKTFDQPSNDIFWQIIESMQYNAALAKTEQLKEPFDLKYIKN